MYLDAFLTLFCIGHYTSICFYFKKALCLKSCISLLFVAHKLYERITNNRQQ